jgi:Xaa-Pro aminopeptidase
MVCYFNILKIIHLGEAKSLIKQINASNAFVVPITKNLVDRLWKDRPEPEIQKVIRLSKNGVGEDIPTKLNRVRNEYVKKKCDSIIIGALDEIACKL